MIRTRSRNDSQRRTSGLHRHAVTPVRRPPKRRRLGRSSLAIKFFSTSDSELSEPPQYTSPSCGPRAKLRRIKTKNSKLKMPQEEVSSPRKRKRSDRSRSNSTNDSGSWIETDAEMDSDLIKKEDEYMLQSAPAHTLHRLRKNELIHLWKVAGMWPDHDMENQDPHLDKAQLVTGIIATRQESSASGKSSSFETSFSYNAGSSSSSTLTSPPESSDPPSRDVDMTPKATRRTRVPLQPLRAAPRKDRLKKGRAKAKQPLKARFGPNVKSPEQRTTRLGTRSSSQFSTTDASTDDNQSTPLVNRLRPRKNTSTATSKASNEDADAEDNGEDSLSPAARRRSSSFTRRRHQRGAKQVAMTALSNGSRSSASSWEEASPEPSKDGKALKGATVKGSKAGSRSSKGSKGSRGSKGSNASPTKTRGRSARRGSDVVMVEDAEADVNSARTTRSGKVFGEIRDSPERDDESSYDEGEAKGVEEPGSSDLAAATMSSLTRLRRDELVQMCEVRSLAVGGTKSQLAQALLDWRDEDQVETTSTTSSQGTAKPSTPDVKMVKAVASNSKRDGQATPVLLRTHLHGDGPVTPPRSDEGNSASAQDNDLNLDLQELGLEDFTIKPEHLVKLDKIGSGGFKDVYVGKLRGRKVAISEFRGHLSEMDMRELKLLAEFRHPNIVRFRGICIPEDSSQVPCMLISELCENGDLYDYIRNVPPPSHKIVFRLMLDIAKGLEYLHLRTPSIIHRDCKSTNILITRSNVAKVGDFGLARVKNSTRSMIASLVGTVNWQAPELWHANPRYDYKVDVFSAALVYWEMLSGWLPNGDKKYPWEGRNEHYIYDAVGQKHKRPSLAGLRKYWGSEVIALIERMWAQDPRERPTMSEVVHALERLVAEHK